MNGPSTMTVAELQEALNNFSPDALVLFANDYGDMGHTMQVTGIDTIEESEIEESGYSRSGWALPSTEDEDDAGDDPAETGEPEEEKQLFVILR